MILKEKYFTTDNIDREADLIKKQVTSHIPAKKGWNPTPSGTALLVTDMQHYFLDPGSHAYIPSAPAILSKIQLLLALFREKGMPVIFTRHMNTVKDAACMAAWWSRLVEPGSDDSLIVEELKPESDTVIAKTQYNAFYRTPLEDILKQRSVEFLVVAGVMTNLCSETSLRESFARGFLPVMPVDATATYSRELHKATFTSLAFGYCPVMTTAEVIKRLEP